MASSYKTPGVYIEEISKFPPSVAQVETAIPAFIGYTEKAEKDNDRTALLKVPTRIKSMEEFRSKFGGAPKPSKLEVKGKMVDDVYNPTGAVIEVEYKLYYSLELFFNNGGGTCYIISVGDYEDNISDSDLGAGLTVLEQYDEPTLIVIPDAVEVDNSAKHGSLMADCLCQCNKLQDRFTIMDVYNGNESSVNGSSPSEIVNIFRTNLSSNYLKYGAAYYPFFKTFVLLNYTHEDITFQDHTGATIADMKQLDNSATGSDFDALVDDLTGAKTLRDDIKALLDIETFKADYQTAITSADDQDKLANAGQELRDKAEELVGLLNTANYTLPASSSLKEAIEKYLKADSDSKELRKILESLVAYDFHYPKLGIFTYSGSPEALSDAAFDGTSFSGAPDYELGNLDLPNLVNIYTGASDKTEKFQKGAPYFNSLYSRMVQLMEEISASADNHVINAELALKNTTVYQNVMSTIRNTYIELPPSAAVAGIYARVDEQRGVWKAPANLVVSSIFGPSVKVDDQEQEGLNVDPTSGKSVNAIRSFTGKGTLVWGARTLAGNDNEWRYVPVRRLFIMVEESLKKSTAWVVFEPNDANTWVRVRAMIENFLTTLWRSGALAGAITEEAFFVKVGLNETMTSQDILEGRMIIEIGMAAVRPAEFIILRFIHKMQES